MFLFDPTFGESVENCEGEIRRLLERAQGELLFSKKWDERRLAYKLKGRKRGVYWLTYFKAPTDRIAGLERDCQISETVLRILVLRADGVTPDMMERAVAAHGAELVATTDRPRRSGAPNGEMDVGFGEDNFDRGDGGRRGDRDRRGQRHTADRA